MSNHIQHTDLIITPLTGKSKQSKRPKLSNAINWEERKFLLSAIQFLTYHWDVKHVPEPLCVCVGGKSLAIKILSDMFPAVTFHAYETTGYNDNEVSSRNVEFAEEFTPDIAKNYSGRSDVFFISDIRSSDISRLEIEQYINIGIREFHENGQPIINTGNEYKIEHAKKLALEIYERTTLNDMQRQKMLLEIVEPVEALLKFQLPKPKILNRENETIKYLKGILYWQIYGEENSTETRLKPTRNEFGKFEIAEWNILEYDSWCNYHNSVTRNKYYINPLNDRNAPIDPPELLNDYDGSVETFILMEYLQHKLQQEISENDIKNTSRALTWALNDNQTPHITLSKLRKFKVTKGLQTSDPFRDKSLEIQNFSLSLKN